VRWVLVSSPKQQVIGQDEMVSSYSKAGLDLILGKISSLKGLSITSTGCSGNWLSYQPWRYLKAL